MRTNDPVLTGRSLSLAQFHLHQHPAHNGQGYQYKEKTVDKLEELTTMIADEIVSAPEDLRSDMALQVASSLVELCGYEMARSGVVKASTRLFLLANEIERLRRAEREATDTTARVVPFVPRETLKWATA